MRSLFFVTNKVVIIVFSPKYFGQLFIRSGRILNFQMYDGTIKKKRRKKRRKRKTRKRKKRKKDKKKYDSRAKTRKGGLEQR